MTKLTDEQEKARNSLKRALDKCHRAGLKLRVYETSVFVAPDWHGQPDEMGNHLDEDTGFFTVNSSIDADGGAGV